MDTYPPSPHFWRPIIDISSIIEHCDWITGRKQRTSDRSCSLLHCRGVNLTAVCLAQLNTPLLQSVPTGKVCVAQPFWWGSPPPTAPWKGRGGGRGSPPGCRWSTCADSRRSWCHRCGVLAGVRVTKLRDTVYWSVAILLQFYSV